MSTTATRTHSTPLLERMREDPKLAGLGERTQEAHLDAVRHLANHYGKSPVTLDEDALRKYFMYLRDEKKQARSSITIALCGIKLTEAHSKHPRHSTRKAPRGQLHRGRAHYRSESLVPPPTSERTLAPS